VEIAFFDRGPLDAEQLVGGGHWSAYWYNGHIYGSEMVRGFDVLRLTPSEHLSQNEIDAAMSVRMREFNAQHQPRFEWPASFAVSRSYVDQLERAGTLPAAEIARIRGELDQAERSSGSARAAAADRLVTTAAGLDAEVLKSVTAGQAGNATRVRALLAASLRHLADTLR
jgi:hypothetical protein